MKFKMNNQEWEIKEVEQEEFYDNKEHKKDEGYFFGQTHFNTQEVWIDCSLKENKKKNTLYHELMHVYLKSYITSGDCNYDEESLCDISANAHDIIHEIVEKYFKVDKKDKN